MPNFVKIDQFWQCGPTLHYSVDLRLQTYTEPVPLNHGNVTTKCPWTDGYFLQCTADDDDAIDLQLQLGRSVSYFPIDSRARGAESVAEA